METQGYRNTVPIITAFWKRWNELAYAIGRTTRVLLASAGLIVAKFFR